MQRPSSQAPARNMAGGVAWNETAGSAQAVGQNATVGCGNEDFDVIQLVL